MDLPQQKYSLTKATDPRTGRSVAVPIRYAVANRPEGPKRPPKAPIRNRS